MVRLHLVAGRDVMRSRAPPSGRSLAKEIAERALFLDLTEPEDPSGHLKAARAALAGEARNSPGTLRRCLSEARALIAFGHEQGAIARIQARDGRSERALRSAISAWLDRTNLSAVLKLRAARLNRSRGGRPPARLRTLRAVEDLLASARAGRESARDELRSIRDMLDRG